MGESEGVSLYRSAQKEICDTSGGTELYSDSWSWTSWSATLLGLHRRFIALGRKFNYMLWQ